MGFDNLGVMLYGFFYIFDGEIGIVIWEIILGFCFVKGLSFDIVEVFDDDLQLYVEVMCLFDCRQVEEEKFVYWRQYEMLVDGEVKLDKEEIEFDVWEVVWCVCLVDMFVEMMSEFVVYMLIFEGVD